VRATYVWCVWRSCARSQIYPRPPVLDRSNVVVCVVLVCVVCVVWCGVVWCRVVGGAVRCGVCGVGCVACAVCVVWCVACAVCVVWCVWRR
jgi:hypothetical protein